jgi:hypothetical protein
MAEAHQLEAEPVGSAVPTAAAPVGIVESSGVEDIEVIGRREDPPPLSAGPRWSFSPPEPARPARIVHQLPAPSLGPMGRRRHPLAVIALTIISLGGYAVVWHRRVNREMGDFDARLEVHPGASALAIFLAWFTGLASSLAGAAIIAADYLHHGPQLPIALGAAMSAGLLASPYLTLLLPPALIATVMTLERLRLVQERVGMRTDRQVRPVARLTVLLIPVFGGLWHLGALQSKLNTVWLESRIAGLPEPPPLTD